MKTARIEYEIRRLGNSIGPRQDHRDLTLDRATESAAQRRARNQSARTIVTMSMVFLLISPLIGWVTRLDLPKRPTDHSVHAATLDHSRKHHLSYSWSLVEVVKQLGFGARK